MGKPVHFRYCREPSWFLYADINFCVCTIYGPAMAHATDGCVIELNSAEAKLISATISTF